GGAGGVPRRGGSRARTGRDKRSSLTSVRGAVVPGEFATWPPAWQTAKPLRRNHIQGEFATLPLSRPPWGWQTRDRLSGPWLAPLAARPSPTKRRFFLFHKAAPAILCAWEGRGVRPGGVPWGAFARRIPTHRRGVIHAPVGVPEVRSPDAAGRPLSTPSGSAGGPGPPGARLRRQPERQRPRVVAPGDPQCQQQPRSRRNPLSNRPGGEDDPPALGAAGRDRGGGL